MTLSVTHAPQLAAQAGRGNLRALRQLLDDLIDHVDGLSPTELGYIDGVTAGTVAASKAVVVDASKNATWGGILTLSSLVNTQAAITTLTGTTATLGTAGVTTLTATSGAMTTNSVTNARLGINATQGTFAAFGVTPVSQLAAITGGGTTAVTSTTNAFGFETAAQGNAVVAAVNRMRAIFQDLGFAITSVPA